MARGGYRPGAGRPKGAKNKAKEEHDVAAPVAAEATPLEYMLAVMRDAAADPVRRDRMAIAAAPFLHPRLEPVGQGKKEAAKQAAEKLSGAGRFAAAAPPKLVVNNRG